MPSKLRQKRKADQAKPKEARSTAPAGDASSAAIPNSPLQDYQPLEPSTSAASGCSFVVAPSHAPSQAACSRGGEQLDCRRVGGETIPNGPPQGQPNEVSSEADFQPLVRSVGSASGRTFATAPLHAPSRAACSRGDARSGDGSSAPSDSAIVYVYPAPSWAMVSPDVVVSEQPLELSFLASASDRSVVVAPSQAACSRDVERLGSPMSERQSQQPLDPSNANADMPTLIAEFSAVSTGADAVGCDSSESKPTAPLPEEARKRGRKLKNTTSAAQLSGLQKARDARKRANPVAQTLTDSQKLMPPPALPLKRPRGHQAIPSASSDSDMSVEDDVARAAPAALPVVQIAPSEQPVNAGLWHALDDAIIHDTDGGIVVGTAGLHGAYVREIEQAGLLDGYYALLRPEFQLLAGDVGLQMDIESLMAYLCFVGYQCRETTQIVVVSPHYTRVPGNGEASANAWGAVASFDVAVIPVCYDGHYAVAFYERGCPVLYYDSMPMDGRPDSATAYQIRNAVSQLDPAIAEADVAIVRADPATYNLQSDGVNCGFFACIYAELFLLKDKDMFLEDFSVEIERERIVGILLELADGRQPFYFLPGQGELEDELPTPAAYESDDDPVDAWSIPPSESLSSMSVASAASSTSSVNSAVSTPRRTGLRPRTPVAYTPVRSTPTRPSLRPLKHCRKDHGNLGCFASSAGHKFEYLDCGKLGDKVCPHCGALLFSAEDSSMCCRNGAIELAPVTPKPADFDALLADPTAGKELRQKFRMYNSLLKFGSFEAGRKSPPGRGAPVVLMNGEIKHCLSNLYFRDGETPTYGQLYVLDPQEAADAFKANALLQRFNLQQPILSALLAILRRTHPLSQAYNTMHSLYQQERARLMALGVNEVPRVQLTLLNESEIPAEVRDRSLHARQVNVPTCNGKSIH